MHLAVHTTVKMNLTAIQATGTAWENLEKRIHLKGIPVRSPFLQSIQVCCRMMAPEEGGGGWHEKQQVGSTPFLMWTSIHLAALGGWIDVHMRKGVSPRRFKG